ncbi:MAG: serine/threonine protein kinase [Polyangiales bacterium]|jgi:serine/threonine protein kinase
MADVLPRSFGKYLLERRLGVGGMAETFVARREGSGGIEQHVCLKRVLPAFNGDKSFRDQFQREARLAARLRHSNIVGTIDYGSVGDVQYMALELVDGLDLRALLSAQPEKRLPEASVVLVAFDIAHALEYAHEPRQDDEGIVHRDVTPSNVLLSIHGEVKLADFGVAKALGTATAMTATGVMKGKMPYMPPEQMKGGAIDGRVDLFSLGVLMYEALAGRRPFVGAHDVEVMSRIISGDRPTLLELMPEVTPGLADVVESLLAIEPEDRVSNATALIDLLTPFVPPPSTRAVFAKLIQVAYGEERHEGAGSDTVLAGASELPVPGATPSADAYASTAIAPSTTHPKGRRSAPTIREMQSPEPSAVSTPHTDPATLFGRAILPSTTNDDQDTLDDQPNVVPVTMSHALAPELRDTRDDRPKRAVAVSTARHRQEANGGRSRGVAAVFFVGLLAAGGAFFFSGDSLEPSVAMVTPPPVDSFGSGSVGSEPQFESPESSESSESPADALPEGQVVPARQTAGAAQAMPQAMPAPSPHNLDLPVPAEPSASAPAQPPPIPAITMLGVSRGSGRRMRAPAAAALAAERPETESAAPSSQVATAVDSEMDARRPARVPVRVTVAPWGFVWIDGHFMGRSPVNEEMTPGRHRIGAGQDREAGPVMHRRVSVPRDRRRRLPVHLDLETVLSME